MPDITPEDTAARVAKALAKQERAARRQERLERLERHSYGVSEFARMVGTDRSTIHRWAEKGIIGSVKIGGRRFIFASELDRFSGKAS
jgi:excisionase family DNA binding protein